MASCRAIRVRQPPRAAEILHTGARLNVSPLCNHSSRLRAAASVVMHTPDDLVRYLSFPDRRPVFVQGIIPFSNFALQSYLGGGAHLSSHNTVP